MTEPLTVRIERISGNQRSPIPMPVEEGSEYPAGSGLARDTIVGLEQWLVTEWAGGGMFEISVTDSTEPQPVTMKWVSYWDPKQFPMKTPPTLADAANNTAPPMPTNAMQQLTQAAPPQFAPNLSTPFQRAPMSTFPNGLPPGMQQPIYQQPQYQPQPQFVGYQMPLPPPPPVAAPAYGAWKEEARERAESAELKALREKTAALELQTLQAKHQAELERIRTEAEAKAQAAARQTEQQLAELRTMIAAAQKPATDPALDLLKRELEETKRAAEIARADASRKADEDHREREAEKREREAEKRDAETRAQIQRTAEESNRKFELLIAQMKDNKPDQLAPIFAMMQEQSRNHNESIKEIARSNQSAIERMQASMMNPRDVVAMTREQQAGTDVATERMGNMYGRMLDLQQKATEQLIGMQPGGSGVVDVVRDGITSLKEVGEKWIGGKSASERFQAQAQASVAEAQARAVEAQAQAQTYQAAAAAGHPLPIPGGGLGGASVTNGPQTSSASIGNVAPGPKRLGKTEVEWFTAAFVEDVREARKDVMKYVATVASEKPEGTSPAACAEGVIQMGMLAQQHKTPIPALDVLLFQERFAEFLDVLIPDAPQGYRDETAQIIIATLRRISGREPIDAKPPEPTLKVVPDAEPDDGEGEDEDEGDDESDPEATDPEDGKVTPAPVAAKPTKPAPNGRARA